MYTISINNVHIIISSLHSDGNMDAASCILRSIPPSMIVVQEWSIPIYFVFSFRTPEDDLCVRVYMHRHVDDGTCPRWLFTILCNSTCKCILWSIITSSPTPLGFLRLLQYVMVCGSSGVDSKWPTLITLLCACWSWKDACEGLIWLVETGVERFMLRTGFRRACV